MFMLFMKKKDFFRYAVVLTVLCWPLPATNQDCNISLSHNFGEKVASLYSLESLIINAKNLVSCTEIEVTFLHFEEKLLISVFGIHL